MIAVQDLTKVYGSRQALDRVSFDVPEREIFGFVGPNGAGKTTTMRILAGLLEPNGGKAFINGIDVTKDREKVHTAIGYMPDFFGVYDELTVGEYLDFYASCYRQPKQRRQKIVDDLLALVGMSERKGQLVDTLSRGLKQRVCLARALVDDPAVLLLDEPASGLDPRARVEMREILKELQRMGKTIVISSHILPELTELCTMIGIIDQGRMRAVGSVRDVIERLASGRRIRITVISEKDAAMEVLEPLPAVKHLIALDGTIEAEYEGDEVTASDILFALTQAGIRVSSFTPVDGGLEDAFLRATSEEVG